jgi:hypothetical protein
MTDINRLVRIAECEISELRVGSVFELRTLICLHNFELWESLTQADRQELGSGFAKIVVCGLIKGVHLYPKTLSDGHNWYKKEYEIVGEEEVDYESYIVE